MGAGQGKELLMVEVGHRVPAIMALETIGTEQGHVLSHEVGSAGCMTLGAIDLLDGKAPGRPRPVAALTVKWLAVKVLDMVDKAEA
jgi:hypothetical protein